MALLPVELQRIVDFWAAAELAGDAAGLDAVLHRQFLFAGPYGYLLDRTEWLSRVTPGTRYYAVTSTLTFAVDVPARVVGDTALVVGTLAQVGTAQGEPYDGRYRTTLVLIREPDWRIIAIHLSLREPARSG
jgi:Domain of unknown function (DUF4440)